MFSKIAEHYIRVNERKGEVRKKEGLGNRHHCMGGKNSG